MGLLQKLLNNLFSEQLTVCPNGCQTPLFGEYCAVCGSKIVKLSRKICSCGEVVYEGYKFCPCCGVKVSQ